MNEKHERPCPQPECDAKIRIADNVPAGEYLCICHACTLRLRWDTYLERGLVPRLQVVKHE